MSKYKHLFFPTTNSIDQVNESTVFIAMVAFVGVSIIYIMFAIKQLKLIFKNRDYSFKQNSYIVFKILVIAFLIYMIYEIAIIILAIS
ncbi:MAG: hypothetical protein PHD15_07040 [Clostridia bacterium]|nr:hypothetical protein [Clostridia bacterium]MDD4387484.1 hypothetical protein [Clostridia bacterium]